MKPSSPARARPHPGSAAKGYRILPHTSEIALEIGGRTWEEFYRNAASGIFALYDLAPASRSARRISKSFEGDSPEDLLVAWLSELVFLISTGRWAPGKIECLEAGPKVLKAELRGALSQEGRPPLAREIKAVTYHGLRVERKRGGWKARVILDV